MRRNHPGPSHNSSRQSSRRSLLHPLPHKLRRFISQPPQRRLRRPLAAISPSYFRRSIKETQQLPRPLALSLRPPRHQQFQNRTRPAASLSSFNPSLPMQASLLLSRRRSRSILHRVLRIHTRLRPAAALPNSFEPSSPARTPKRPPRSRRGHPPPWPPRRADKPEPQPASSFTQIFRAIEGTPALGASPNPPPQTWGQVPQSQSSPVVPPPYAPPVSEAPRSEGSNLTQLLRNLDQSGSVEPPPPPPAKRPDAFTSLYGEQQPPINLVERMQSASPATSVGQPPRADFAAAPAAGGASDFTRIIQASSLREQALKQGEQSVEAAKPAAQAAPVAPVPSAPQIPGFPGAAPPQFPHPSVLPPLNFGQGGAMPPAQPFRAPNLAPPQWMPPAPQPPAPAPPTKAQPLLPLILIGVIFVLVVVLVAVIFLMKR